MHRREYILASGAVLGASSIGAVAFTSASLDRAITIDVAADNNAVIGLNPQVSGIQLTNDVLEINPSNGLNPEATFTYGDGSNPDSTPAFTVTNNDTDPHDYTFSITGTLTIDLYDSTEASIGSVSNGNPVTTNLASGDYINAVFSVDTSGLDSTNTINETLTIASP